LHLCRPDDEVDYASLPSADPHVHAARAPVHRDVPGTQDAACVNVHRVTQYAACSMQVDVVLDAHRHSPARLHRLLAFDARQRPLAVQLGGRDPDRMAQAARLYVLRDPRCSVLYSALPMCRKVRRVRIRRDQHKCGLPELLGQHPRVRVPHAHIYTPMPTHARTHTHTHTHTHAHTHTHTHTHACVRARAPAGTARAS
jgi:hypothetical protein